MDKILSEFVTKTSLDVGLSRDLLQGHNWNLMSALNAFYVMKGMVPTPECQVFEEQTDQGDLTRQSISISTTKCNSLPSLSSPTSTPSSFSESSANSSPSKLAISKSDINDADFVDVSYPKKLVRGISRATDNVNLVSKARNEFAQDFGNSLSELKYVKSNLSVVNEAPDYTFTLPDLSIHQDDFREFLEKDLIEKSTLLSLEYSGRLNWWHTVGACQKLWPLATTGDGNCLLHAASLGMWGFHDRLLTLRKALHALLINSTYTTSFYRRWRWQTSIQNKEAGLIYCEEEWNREWDALLKMASTEPRMRANGCDTIKSNELSGGKKSEAQADEIQPHVYESLEEIHILALAHVLKRPIIVIADTMLKDVKGEPFAPIPFGGLFLPLECDPSTCHKSPLCLTYDAAHFSSLVAMDKETYADKTPHLPSVIPLVDPEHELLPIQFAIDPGKDVRWMKDECDDEVIRKISMTEKEKWNLLNQYFCIKKVRIPGSSDDRVDDAMNSDSSDKLQLLADEANCNSGTKRSGILEKSLTLPSNFEFDDESGSSDAGVSTTSIGRHSSGGLVTQSRSKAAKQLQLITKHFGSLGRTMSKKIRKNLGNLARRGTSFRSKSNNSSPTKKKSVGEGEKLNSVQEKQSRSSDASRTSGSELNLGRRDVIISAVLHIEKRHEYQDEMIRNYLNTARARMALQNEKKRREEQNKSRNVSPASKSSTSSGSSSYISPSSNVESVDLVAQCVGTGCKNFGSSATNYLCSTCFSDQKEEFNNIKGLNDVNSDKNAGESKVSDLLISKVTLESPAKTLDTNQKFCNDTFPYNGLVNASSNNWVKNN